MIVLQCHAMGTLWHRIYFWRFREVGGSYPNEPTTKPPCSELLLTRSSGTPRVTVAIFHRQLVPFAPFVLHHPLWPPIPRPTPSHLRAPFVACPTASPLPLSCLAPPPVPMCFIGGLRATCFVGIFAVGRASSDFGFEVVVSVISRVASEEDVISRPVAMGTS